MTPTPEEKIYYCYKATNDINGKIYIGFSVNPKSRWTKHKSDADNGGGQVFHDAIRKYGWEHFHFEVICCSKNREEMMEHVEPDLIQQYKSLINQNGYNMYRYRPGAQNPYKFIPRVKSSIQFNPNNSILDFIKHMCVNPETGKFKPIYCREAKLRDLNVWFPLLTATSFLDKDVKVAERFYCVLNGILEPKLCKHCKTKPVTFEAADPSRNRLLGYLSYCSAACGRQNTDSQDKYKATHLIKYGVENPLQNQEIKSQIKERTRAKYGVDHITQTQEFKDQIKATNLLKYGVEVPAQNPDILKKMQSTMQERYGVENPGQYKEFQDKRIATVQERYGNRSIQQLNIPIEILNKLQDPNWLRMEHYDNKKPMTEIAKDLGVSLTLIVRRCQELNIPAVYYPRSIAEKELVSFIETLTKEPIVTNSKSFLSENFELDLVIPSHNFAIELDGIYWHSFDRIETKEERNYHLKKTELCLEKGIKLFHIFDSEWNNPAKKEIWKSMIAQHFSKNQKIGARKCERIEQVSVLDRQEFLEENHLQGDCPSSVNLGLAYNGELISLMTFGKSRFSEKYEWEMIRYCTKIGYSIVGGASKLWSMFVKKMNPKSVVTFADRRHSTGKIYSELGFTHAHNTSPNYFYYLDNLNVLESRIKYQKHKLPKLLNHFDENLTEAENMFKNDFRRIWDCGNMVYSALGVQNLPLSPQLIG